MFAFRKRSNYRDVRWFYFFLTGALFNRRVGILFERNHWMRMRRVWHDISVVLSTREREKERFVWKAYRKLVGDFPHDSSMNVEPSIVGWKNDEKFSTDSFAPFPPRLEGNSEEFSDIKIYPVAIFVTFAAQVGVKKQTVTPRERFRSGSPPAIIDRCQGYLYSYGTYTRTTSSINLFH